MVKKGWDNKQTNELLEAIMLLKTSAEAKDFLRDLLTEHELVEFGQRWKAVRMLDSGKPYSEIERTTGLSSRTIARISKWLQTGRGGYGLILDRWKRKFGE